MTVRQCHHADQEWTSSQTSSHLQYSDTLYERFIKVKVVDFYHSHGNNAAITCRHFGISNKTFYKCKGIYDFEHPSFLEDRSRHPRRLRQPTWSSQLAQAVLKLREEPPRWGKEKLALLLHQHGFEVSISMVGHILKSLKARNLLREPMRSEVSAHKRYRPRLYAIGKPNEYQPKSAWGPSRGRPPWTSARTRH